uniref:Insulin receptor substrate 1 n=1 Tax=Otus sunia TaxID=257818 RepID=A0A8C8BMH9_9STRI
TEIATRGGKLETGKGCRERRKGTPAPLPGFFSDVRKVGYLRKPKSMHKRFFVLRAASESGPARLEYYENEKKWRHKSGAPKRSIPLESCFNINKRADSKNKHLVALYTKDEHFAIAADSEPEQESWYQALLQLHNRAKAGEDSYGEVAPGPAFKEVWQVILKPKGLGQTKNLIGIYRLCLTNKTISFVKLNSDAAAVVLQLLNIRRCGHSENFFFIEVGRSAVTGPGEFWMQVDDSVVAQNMHETILEAIASPPQTVPTPSLCLFAAGTTSTTLHPAKWGSAAGPGPRASRPPLLPVVGVEVRVANPALSGFEHRVTAKAQCRGLPLWMVARLVPVPTGPIHTDTAATPGSILHSTTAGPSQCLPRAALLQPPVRSACHLAALVATAPPRTACFLEGLVLRFPARLAMVDLFLLMSMVPARVTFAALFAV